MLTDERNERFMALLRPVYRDCQRWAYTLTGDQVDAEDVLEEGILTALKSLHQLKNDEAFKTWMFSILRTTWYMQVRVRKHHADSVEPAELERLGSGRTGDAERGETAALVHNALSKLAPEQRMALELFELHELSIRQVARVMGKAETAVRVQLHRARSRMAEMLREAGLDPGDIG
ncbi:MAG: RNA polymerase sigma factor [bacterium]|nr:RNA polymerase sigma factor [bacterium]